jgi:hypothetical protein
MTSSCNVERWLHEIQLTELKNRAHHLNIYKLEDAVKLNVQHMAGRCTGMQANYLTTTPAESQARGVTWQASEFGLRAQRAYSNFFGERELPARDILTPEARVSDKPRLAGLRSTSEKSLKQQMQRHCEALKVGVAENASEDKTMFTDMCQAAVECTGWFEGERSSS